MNIVKAQEYAQSLPLAELKKYADGFDPTMIPPWLATGEMQAKAKRAEMANNLQGAATGQQPSVKEQVEQKAGILALQQAQQQAQAQQMMQPRMGAGPVPEGTPEPRPQPRMQAGLDQLTSNIKMAGGGIVAFATGNEVKAGPEFMKFLRQMGIDYIEYSQMTPDVQNNIKDAFKEVGTKPAAQAAAQAAPAAAKAAEGRGLLYGTGKLAGKAVKSMGLPGALASSVENFGDYKLKSDNNIDTSASGTYNDLKRGEFGRAAKGLGMGLVEAGADLGSAAANTLDYVVPGKAPVSSAYDKMLRGTGAFKGSPEQEAQAQQNNQSAAETARLNATAPAVAMGNEGRRTSRVGEGIGTNVSPHLIPANLRPAPKPQGNVPQNVKPSVNPNAPAAPAAPAPDSMEALYRASLEGGPKERKIEDLIAEQNAIRASAGLDEPAGKAKLERIDALNKQYEATKPTGLQELIEMFGKAGQYKGLSGTGPAYTAIEARKRAADLAHAKQINELMGGVEDTQRAEKTGVATNVRTAREKDVDSTSQFNREKMQSLGTASTSEAQRKTQERGQDLTYKAAIEQIRSTAAREGVQQQRLLLETFKAELATIDRDIQALMKVPYSKEAKEQLPDLRARKAGLTKALDEASGISKMLPAPGAGSPGGTRPPISSFQR